MSAFRYRRGVATVVAAGFGVAAIASLNSAAVAAPRSAGAAPTTTPIKHVIVIIGENHTFDNVFATYQPPAGQKVLNLRSEGIVTASGSPGPRAGQAQQQTAIDNTSYSVTPTKTGSYPTLPQPNTTYVSSACDGQPANRADSRFPTNLTNAPYQITKYVPYFDDHGQYSQNGTCEFTGAYVGDPIHRFYQMYQQVDAGKNDLFTWVHQTAGDSNGNPPPLDIATNPEATDQGALDMGFYNMAQGDAPVLNDLAQHYAMSDDYHQAVMGGTGANHIMLGTGDAAFYQDANGNAATPPTGEVENPDPQAGTNNFYTQDGYGQAGTQDGGSYSDCSNPTAAGVVGVDRYLSSLPHKVANLCAPAHYYLLNNYNPGYNVDGSLNTSTFTVPPQKNLVTIGNELSNRSISWGYFGEGYDNGNPGPNYCGICDPMQYSSLIMANPALRANTEHGIPDFDAETAAGALPAVSFVKPGDDDGHPGYSTLAAFEGFVTHVVDEVQANRSLWKSTAIVVTFDEGGGYYDSGPIQPVSFFGDGTRVPLIVVSPYTRAGYVDHTYEDHVSILKFIEANWQLGPLTDRSLDNLPNPIQRGGSYLPSNGPAIGNLMTLFDFKHAPQSTPHHPPRRGGGASPHANIVRPGFAK